MARNGIASGVLGCGGEESGGGGMLAILPG